MENAFVFARLLPYFNIVLKSTDAFPKQSQKLSEGKKVTVFQSESWPFNKTIRYEFCDEHGICHTVEIRNEDGEILIGYSSGV